MRESTAGLAYQPQCDDANDVHEDVATLAQHDGIEWDEWLRRAKSPKFVGGRLERLLACEAMVQYEEEAYRAEQEQDDGSQATATTDDSTPKDTPSGSDRSILGFFSHMSGRVEANQDTGRGHVGQTPVPTSRGTSPIVSGHESLLSSSETPSVGSPNREPDQVQEEIEHDHAGREPENIFEEARGHEVQQSSQAQHDLGADPLDGAKLDIGCLCREVDVEHSDLGEHVVDSGLGVAGTERCPGGGTPPSHYETEQSTESGTASFSSPEIDGTCGWRRRAHFGNDGGRDEGEDHGD